ncbi:MAG: UDP-N-acetylmuramoyl-L-alanine--D-glutamate ligase [Polyangiaceae bacterium]
MLTSSIAEQHVSILGFGLEGRSVARALRRWGHHGLLVVFVDGAPPTDAEAESLGPIEFLDATNAAHDGTLSERFDWLVRSPGVPPSHPLLVAAAAQSLAVTTSTNLFLERVRDAGLPVIGITGSKGKSTTSTLTHLTLEASGVRSVLVGNIGAPCLDRLDEIVSTRATTVIELSSYQCNDLTLGPSIAVILCLFPEHLDWHGSLEAYYGAKLRLAKSQRPDDVVVFHADDRELSARLPLGPSKHVGFGRNCSVELHDGSFYVNGQKLFDDTMRLRGAHNRLNALAALTAASQAGVDLVAHASEISSAISVFEGLPHRLEVVGEVAGVRWVNDSISTAPEAAVAAIEAFGDDVGSIIVGGHDRGYDFTPLYDELVAKQVTKVAVLPASGLRLAELISSRAQLFDQARRIDVYVAKDVPDAVRWCANATPLGRTCLFSPASPSYGVYKDFQQRGEHFRREVKSLAPG